MVAKRDHARKVSTPRPANFWRQDRRRLGLLAFFFSLFFYFLRCSYPSPWLLFASLGITFARDLEEIGIRVAYVGPKHGTLMRT